MWGLSASVGALFVLTALGAVAVGHSRTVHLSTWSAVLFAVTVTSGAAVFMASRRAHQPARGQPSASGCLWRRRTWPLLRLRMVADSSAGLTWVHWITPFGWIERLQHSRIPDR